MEHHTPEIRNEQYSFVDRQLSLLGERDPLEVLARTGSLLRAYVTGRTVEELDMALAPGKWSPHEIIAHMAFTEWIFGFRTRSILCDDRPTLEPADQERWIMLGHVGDVETIQHIEDFAALRRINLALWSNLGPQELARVGFHAEASAEMSVGFLLRLLAGHDLNHLGQLGISPP